jgi:hypothetical protein
VNLRYKPAKPDILGIKLKNVVFCLTKVGGKMLDRTVLGGIDRQRYIETWKEWEP